MNAAQWEANYKKVQKIKALRLSTARLRAEENQIRRSVKFVSDLTVNATESEIILKEALEDAGVVFEFQKSLHRKQQFYIVDFYIKCQHRILAIELDGALHFTPKRKKADQERTIWLHKYHNVTVKRYPNGDVYKRLPNILTDIFLQRPEVIKLPVYKQ